jgi:hypothetical protein
MYLFSPYIYLQGGDSECFELRLKRDGTRAETRFRLSAKRTIPFKSAGASVQSTTGSRGVSISGSNAGCTMFRGSVKSTGYPLHSPVSPSVPLPCVTVCHHISTGLYQGFLSRLKWLERSPPCGAEVKNEWRCTSSPRIYLRGADSECFTFLTHGVSRGYAAAAAVDFRLKISTKFSDSFCSLCSVSERCST